MVDSATRPSDETHASARTALVAGVLGAVVATVVTVAALRGHGAPVRTTDAPPRDPTAYVPPGARAVLSADIARLRGVRALAPLFGSAGAHEPCEARLVRGVERVAVVAADTGFDDVGVAFAGALPRDELVACVRARQGGATTLSSHRDADGRERVTLGRAQDPALLPPMDAASIVYLPGGVVLAGARSMVQRMEDRGALHALGRSENTDPTLGALATRLGGTYPVSLRVALGRGAIARAFGVGDEAAFAHVTGLAIGASFEGGGLDAVAVLACDDFDAPRAVADALVQARDAVAAQLVLPSLTRALHAASVERGAAEVRVRLALDESELATLVTASTALANAALQPDAPPTAPRDR